MDEEPNIYGRFGIVDYVVFAIMLCVSTAIGVFFGCFSKNSQSTEEYLLGGRKMKTLPIAISLLASQLSGISIMAIPAEMYTFGSQYFMIVPTMIPIVLIINYVFVPVFYNNHIGNCYEYLELRFSKSVRQVLTATFVISIYLVLPVIIFLPALAFSQVTGLNIHIINAVVCFVCMFYTMLGGIKAVVWTDVIQASIMILSCVLVVVFGVIKVGGLTEVWNRAEAGNRIQFFNMDPNISTRHTFLNSVFGNFVMWASYVGLNQSCVQRIVSVPTIKDARTALNIFGIGFMILMTLNIFTGIVMYARYYDCDPITANIVDKTDKMMPYFVQDVVGHLQGMPGVFISCVFSAALSTMSANLNSLAGIVYEDYVRPLKIIKHNDRNANYTMKFLVLITGTYCILMGFVVEKFSYILQMAMTIVSVGQGATFGVFCLGMLFPWANKKGALWGTLISLACMVWIVVGTQVMITREEFVYPKLPASIENCEAVGINVTGIIVNAVTTINPPDNSFSIYKIAYPWYGVIGTIIVWIIGIPLSFLTGSENLKILEPRLISPVAHWMLPKEVFRSDIQMQVVEKRLLEKEEIDKSEWKYTMKNNNGNK